MAMKQRVGFARALVVHPEVLFLDEPFSALDVLTAENLRHELVELWAERSITTRAVLIVTHNIEEAVVLADRILVLSSNPGRVAADIAVPLPQPRDRLDPEFRQLVDRIYVLMTQRPEPKPAAAKPPRRAPVSASAMPRGLDRTRWPACSMEIARGRA